MKRSRILLPGLLLAALAAAVTGALPARAQQTEGFDPLRQITTQIVKANLLIVLDVSGSMEWDKYGNNVTYDSQGRLNWEDLNSTTVRGNSTSASTGTLTFAGNRVGATGTVSYKITGVKGVGNPGIYTYSAWAGSGPTFSCLKTNSTGGCNSSTTRDYTATNFPVLLWNSTAARFEPAYRCKPTTAATWTETTLNVPWSPTQKVWQASAFDFDNCTIWAEGLYFSYPSRTANVKNALGNSVAIGEDYVPPNTDTGLTGKNRWKDVAWNGTVGPQVTKETSAVGPVLTVTDSYKSLNGNPWSFLFNLDAGYDLTTPTATYNPIATTGVPPNPAKQVNWVSYGNQSGAVPDLFNAFYTTAPATAPYADVEGKVIPSPGLASNGTTVLAATNWFIGWPTDSAKYGSVTPRAPRDIVGKNANRVNFGLQVFSGDWSNPFPLYSPIDTKDTNNVERLQGFLRVRTDPAGTSVYSRVPTEASLSNMTQTMTYETTQIGLNPNGGTPTKAALTFAKDVISNTFSGGSLTASNKVWNFGTGDPKKGCKRTYGIILVTDGMSNTGNPDNGGSYVKPCAYNEADSRVNCDSNSTPNYNCPDNWVNFAPGVADAVFKLKLDKGSGILPVIDRYVYPRTWAIGISPVVGPCELDMIAYLGRTDANSPNGDAGFGGYDAAKNPYLPADSARNALTGSITYATVDANPVNASAGTYDGPTADRVYAKQATLQRPASGTYPTSYTSTDSWWSSYRGTYRASLDLTKDPRAPWWSTLTPPVADPPVTGHGHNAFFATDAAALSDAIATIVNATAAGDYATNAPTSGAAAQAGADVYLPSTDFPSWRGHLYDFDTNKATTDAGYLKWDAGTVLLNMNQATRKIYTWDEASSSPSNKLVEIVDATAARTIIAAKLGVAAGDASVTNLIKFIRGNDPATNAPRTWRLGPMVNSSPAVVGPPQQFKQGNVQDHEPFRRTYSSRVPLVWVGASDGMLHAFRASDGAEQLALVPPDVITVQAKLYANYLADSKYPTGQPRDLENHVYGVANSFRYGDVYFTTSPVGYRTVGIVSLGPGGTSIAAIDISAPSPTDPGYVASEPVKVLWVRKKGSSTTVGPTDIENLQQTWSVPAMAPVGSTTWRLVVGSGFRVTNTAANQPSSGDSTSGLFKVPEAFVLDPRDGNLLGEHILAQKSTPAPWVGSNAFADAVLFSTKAAGYQDDNRADMALQADLNGQIWFVYPPSSTSTSFDQANVGIDVTEFASQSQPVYYAPSASGYGDPTKTPQGCVVYAFASGALYERSDKIVGTSVGTGTSFSPRLYVAVADKASATTKLASGNIAGKAINTIPLPDEDPLQNVGKTVKIGTRAQVTAAQFLLVPTSGSGSSTALFLVYDPDRGCNGYSYIVKVEVENTGTCTPTNVSYLAYGLGVGAASGFTIAGKDILISKSGIGEGARASLEKVPDLAAAIGSIVPVSVNWWRELK